MRTISDAELEIMNVVWSKVDNTTVKDVQASLEDSEWKITTVQTFLQRLVEKEYLRVTKVNRNNYYAALISKAEYTASETSRIIRNVHSGSVKNFVASLIDADNLSAQEIDELKEWIIKR